MADPAWNQLGAMARIALLESEKIRLEHKAALCDEAIRALHLIIADALRDGYSAQSIRDAVSITKKASDIKTGGQND